MRANIFNCEQKNLFSVPIEVIFYNQQLIEKRWDMMLISKKAWLAEEVIFCAKMSSGILKFC